MNASAIVEDIVATGHRLECEARPRKKTGVYFFSSQPKVAGPNMTHDSTDGESDALGGPGGVSSVRPPQKSSLCELLSPSFRIVLCAA